MFKTRFKLIMGLLLLSMLVAPLGSFAVNENVTVGKFNVEASPQNLARLNYKNSSDFSKEIVLKKEILRDNLYEKLEYNININGGGFLEIALDGLGNSDGSYILRDLNGQAIGFVDDIEAIDANDNKLKVETEVNDNTIIQMVKHEDGESIEYPVQLFVTLKAAEDYTYNDWFDSGGGFINRPEGVSLSLYPKNTFALNSHVNLAWETVVDRFGNDYRFYNEDGMFKQFRCHNNFAFFKRPWNLEPWRPNVSYTATVAAGCNPE